MMYYIILLLLIILTILLKPNRAQPKLPPGPKPWPIIGNLHLLGGNPHRSVTKLAKTYGPIMSLKIGSVKTIVISSSKLAKQMFVDHDLALSSRHVPVGGKVGNHDKLSIGWLPVCNEWRFLRKISTLHLFTHKQMSSSEGVRERKVKELVEYVRKCRDQGRELDVGKVVFSTNINVLSNIIFSIDFASYDDDDECLDLKIRGFKDHLMEYIELASKPNLADVFPMVERLDLQGLTRKIGVCFDKIMGVFKAIIEQRLNEGGCFKGDVLESYLQLVKDGELSLDSLKHLLFDLLSAGTSTTSTAIEWALTELLRHPEKMAKAQAEIDQVVGKNNLVEECDIPKLGYTQAVVKETLRFHPPSPFLLPHKAEKDVLLCGYLVPKNTQIWVNTWGISRNPSVWSNPDSFIPERFMETEQNDIKGQGFEFIPFGEGRRICPGMQLAYKVMHLILANLVCSFNWKIGDDVDQNDISVEEKFGIVLERAQPLPVIPLLR